MYSTVPLFFVFGHSGLCCPGWSGLGCPGSGCRAVRVAGRLGVGLVVGRVWGCRAGRLGGCSGWSGLCCPGGCVSGRVSCCPGGSGRGTGSGLSGVG